jgi:hypothetical protein
MELSQALEKIKTDLTGYLIEQGFAYVGRCNCSGCYQDKYKKDNILLKICRGRTDFTLMKNKHIYEMAKLDKLHEALISYGQSN